MSKGVATVADGAKALRHYLDQLDSDQTVIVSQFLDGLTSRCVLPRDEKAALKDDFVAALAYFASVRLPLGEAIARLSMTNLGGFYARSPKTWYRLDDAAKIYPVSMKHGHMEVFRLSMRLREPVVIPLLQMALNFTIKRFPTFATCVKKGFFWHYLDASKRRYAIQPEVGLPCQPLAISGSNSPSFRVTYFHDRVSVEFFHILTDGAGGMTFLKALAATYLHLLIGSEGSDRDTEFGIVDINASPSAAEAANEFPRADKTATTSGFLDKIATQMSGDLALTSPCQILHFLIDASELKRAAKARSASITAYVLALMFLAGRHATEDLTGEINIQVPVDMRKFYPSVTVRNFSMYCGVKLRLEEVTSVDAIIGQIAEQLRRKGSKAMMSQMLNSTLRIVRTVRYVPLFIKSPVARIVYGFLGDKVFSNTLSNLGVVQMPPELADHIRSFGFVLGGAQTNRASCAMVTFNGRTVLSITKMTADPSFEEELLALLGRDNVTVRVEGSDLNAG
ncbi:MAG: hypothetical protein LBV06_06355 [Propionibacteriaceae bacterium]|nr:hypothetical protein [Propionibacteriaceae bacterium]